MIGIVQGGVPHLGITATSLELAHISKLPSFFPHQSTGIAPATHP
jgi:hypothetical protein